MKRLSIIIPVYNAEKHLIQCIESIMGQIPVNSELILIDDGSTDNSSTICDSYALADKRIRVVHKKNAGVSEARNTGLDVAEGEYIFFIDSDDYVTDGYFEKILANKADLVISNYIAFWEDRNRKISEKFESVYYYSRKDFLEHFYLYFATIFNFPWGKLFKRELIQKNGLRFLRDVAVSEDVMFNVAYYNLCESFCICSEANIMYRQRSESLSHTFYEHLINWYELSYEEIYNCLNKANAFTEKNENHFYTHFWGNLLECIDVDCFQNERVMETFVLAVKNSKYAKKSAQYGAIWEKWTLGSGIRKNSICSIKKGIRAYLLIMKAREFVKRLIKR